MKQYVFMIPGLVALILLSSCAGQKQGGPAGTADKKEWLPAIVPYLDCVPSKTDGRGRAVIKPGGPFPAGSATDFEMTFTVGKAGIAAGGFVILQVSPWWGWSEPQDINPRGEGYTTVTPSFHDPSFRVKMLSMHRVLVFSGERGMKPGETLTFKYVRARVDRYAEAEERFMFFVDGDGDGHSSCIADPPFVRIEAREPVRLEVTAPSQANPGRTLRVTAAPLDMAGNWSTFPPGTFTLTAAAAPGQKEEIAKSIAIKAVGKEKKLVFSTTLPRAGIYFFTVKGPAGLAGKSDVLLCRQGKPRLKLYFGDIHGHSRISDGTGTPGDYYCFARDVSGLDIAALTDHTDFGLIPIEGKTWKRIKDAADNAYSPGHFVTFTGFEWTNWNYGHRNVYYRDSDGPVFRSSDPDCDTPAKLWKHISPYEAMTIAHHVGGGPVPVDWDIPPGPIERLVEICSIHGSSEYYGCEVGIYRPRQGHFVRDALSRGYRLGIMASGDTHDGHPGQRSVNAVVNGLVGVYAASLTREAVWEALQKRRVYGTSGPKIILNFRVCDSPMGSEVVWSQSKGPVPIALRTVCCGDIDRVEIIRNGVPIFAEKGEGVFAIFLIEDPEPPEGTSRYYARVLQKDGGMAWSSPVWVNRNSR